jgi:hypothetical protein
MKKLIIIASFLVCSQNIFAQLEKGMISIGLSSALTYSKSTDELNKFSSKQYQKKYRLYNCTNI